MLAYWQELGFISCYYIIYLINLLTYNDKIIIKSVVISVLNTTAEKFKSAIHIIEFMNLMNRAVGLS